MNTRFLSYGMAATVMAGALSCLMLAAPAAAQYGTKDKDLSEVPKDPRYEADPEKKPTPRMANGHVDFTGFWIDYYTDPVGDTIEFSKLNNSKLYNDYDDTPRYGSKYEQDVSGTDFPSPTSRNTCPWSRPPRTAPSRRSIPRIPTCSASRWASRALIVEATTTASR